MSSDLWHHCTECAFPLARCWDICPMCGTDAFLGRPAVRCPACQGVVDTAWMWCPACGNDGRQAPWMQPGQPGS